ncbi:Pre-rRNA-processing protein PNO1 [Apiospora aurea]|uniref:Pre-rRNA-processing protein PNO1 n=1 Tax=Apiospora aurea TaxID=335848 RepID=A0ABR1QAW3_9PEZI
MPAPTALLQKPVEPAAEAPLPQPDQDEEVLLDASEMNKLDTSAIQLVPVSNNEAQMDVDEEGKPHFAPAREIGGASTWPKIYPVVVEHLNLAIRMNVKSKAVELRTTRKTADTGALQKGADFITAFALGFDVDDAIALLRLDDLYIETFEIRDIKNLEGDHKGKLYDRLDVLAQQPAVLADSKIHLLGGFKNIAIARSAISSLVLGKQPGKVYNGLRTVASRMKERF